MLQPNRAFIGQEVITDYNRYIIGGLDNVGKVRNVIPFNDGFFGEFDMDRDTGKPITWNTKTNEPLPLAKSSLSMLV